MGLHAGFALVLHFHPQRCSRRFFSTNVNVFAPENLPASHGSAPLRGFLPADLHPCCGTVRVAEPPQSPLQNRSQTDSHDLTLFKEVVCYGRPWVEATFHEVQILLWLRTPSACSLSFVSNEANLLFSFESHSVRISLNWTAE